jgi:glycosyltransferase involved in cell wall biosynthesis
MSNLDEGTIVHFNDLWAVQSWGPVARLAGRPVVYHHRTLNRMTLPKKVLVNLAHQVVCISQECERNLAFVTASKRTFVINPIQIAGDSLPRRDARLRTVSFGCSNQGRLVGFVGNFWLRKRPRFFLEVCARLASVRPDCSFVMFGRDGDETSGSLTAFAGELGIRDRVTLAGFRLPAEHNIAALDLLIAPALDEPFGRTLVEATVLGTPYLATDDAGHREIWDRWRGGRLAPRDADPGEFASLALDILNEPEKTLLKGHERSRVINDVSASTHAHRIMEIYGRLEIGENMAA